MTEVLKRFSQHFHLQPQAEMPVGVDASELAEWSERACGLACLRTLLAFHGHPVPTQWDLVVDARAIGAYVPRGIVHARLVDLARRHGLDGVATSMPDVRDVLRTADEGLPVIVSVAPQLPDDGRRGGHLVVVGGTARGGQVRIADPSRWGATHRLVGVDRFSSYTGRAVVLWPGSDHRARLP